ncbi:DUF6046 domain-containing protein [Chryseobacterium sp.]|uniref:DUF6046 domain-containing protein n=1 Tax=Chryseobacterium sp. TaxID=1871047 RepID=UPI0012A8502F|nr:DUF6046 domain-containing protein [Chryseobacterium sp.]QFG53636.1 hypothetical protein F7R58_08755 [Chryseobacterium sp.]
MELTNENILLASLMGSKVIKQIPRFEAVQNELSKHVLPPVKFLPVNSAAQRVGDSENYSAGFDLWQNDAAIPKGRQFFPLSFYSQDEQTLWTLPWEPMINIEASNRIIKRDIAKKGAGLIGSIKERWSTDDYNITITGAFYGNKMQGQSSETYPRTDMDKLRDLLLTPAKIKVLCEPLQILNINHIVIESVSFPFTKGENVQAYEIKAVSDFPYNLIYKRKTGVLEVGMPVGGAPEV